MNQQTEVQGHTALSLAIDGGDRSDHKVIDLLLKAGADVNKQCKEEGRTALHNAVTKNWPYSLVQKLLAHGGNPNIADKQGKTPLARGCTVRNIDPRILTDLAVRTDQVGAPDANGRSCLHDAVSSGQSQAVIEALLGMRLPMGINRPALQGGLTVLLAACKAGQAGVVDLLIEAGANVNAKGEKGRSALQVTVRGGMSSKSALTDRIITALLQARADVCAVDDDGGNLLLDASEAGMTGLVSVLMSRREIDACTVRRAGDGHCALSLAIANSHVATATVIIKSQQMPPAFLASFKKGNDTLAQMAHKKQGMKSVEELLTAPAP